MNEMLFLFMIGVLTFTVAMIIVAAAYLRAYREWSEFRHEREKLPAATRWHDLRDRVDDLELAHDRLQDKLQEAEETIRQADRDRDWLDANREEIQDMRREREELEKVRQEFVQASEDLATRRTELTEASEKLQKIAFEVDQLERRLAEADRELKDRQQERDAALQTISKLKSDIEDLERKRAELAEVDRALAAAQHKHDELAGYIADLKDEIKQLEKQREDAQTAYQRSLENRSAAAAEIEGLKATKQSLERQCDTLEDTLGALRASTPGGGGDARLDELWIPAVSGDEYPEDDWQSSEDQALANVDAYLKDHGLFFSKRVINAFHTSLKVANETPLLVLAGISGTGKSLLPRRYSEAMGIHFLPIPVQPRWDGPQDLLGFFNYLEGSYKATELSRALVQFDRHERDWYSDEIEFLDTRLLMVLMDEMNLARVEYYFSEFLSRLESRREIGEDDNASDRKKAEIVLDVGRTIAGDETSDAGRVLAGSNVLFVGTMNEDESTLALSDKVIDRANVMRFGRPPRQSDLPTPRDEPNARRSASPLPFEVWTDWLKLGRRRELPDLVPDTINEINDHLARIGRPFGYRPQLAIEAYVRQYPGRSNEDINMALADQIEQRVMPKLRGLDLSEDDAKKTIEGIQDIAQRLGDKPLVEAIARGMRAHGGHLFAWMGVERTGEDD